MRREGFSLLEIIFTIVVVSIILAIAIPKFQKNLLFSKKVAIKNDIILIREAIINYKNKIILKNETVSLQTLEDSDVSLFSKILKTPIVASSEKKAGAWSKVDTNTYKVYLDNTNYVIFIYDEDNFTFDCNFNNEFCKELTQ